MEFKKSRIFLVFAAALFSILAFPPVFAVEWGIYNHVLDIPKVEAYAWGAPSEVAFTSRLALSGNLFHSSLLLIAAMWGLLLVKKDEAVILFDTWPERTLLLLATLCLLSSCGAHIGFVHVMSSLAMAAAETESIPDLAHRDIAHGLVSQCVCLIGGAGIAALTVISATWLHQRKTQ